jgi:hypothetical protein
VKAEAYETFFLDYLLRGVVGWTDDVQRVRRVGFDMSQTNQTEAK